MKQDKLNVLHISWTLDRGGAEKFITGIVPLLKPQVVSTVLYFTGSGVWKTKLDKHHISVQKIEIYKILKIIKSLRTIKPDAVITYTLYADILGRMIAYLIGCKNCICFIRNNYLKNFGLFPFILLEFLTHRLVRRYLAVSNTVKVSYEKILRYQNIEVINNGIILDKSSKERKINPKALSKHHIILCQAKFSPQKGHFVLLKAFRRLCTENLINAKLILIGNGKLKRKINQWIIDNNLSKKIQILSNIDNINDYLRSSDLLILPSFYEGQANILLEAQNKKCPILASDIAENKEVIRDGINGCLFRTGDYNDLYRKITYVFDPKNNKVINEYISNGYDYVAKTHNLLVKAAQLKNTILNDLK